MTRHQKTLVLFVTLLAVGIAIISLRVQGQATAALSENSYLPLLFKPESTPTPTNTPVPTATNPPIPTPNPGAGWLGYINFLRNQAGLADVTENTDWGYGCELHSRYMVKNDEIGHSEDTSNPWYTAEGNEAAGNSNVMVSSSPSSTDEYGIDLWMSGPFHGVAILDPQLQVVGFGSYREAIGTWQMGAALDVSRGRTSSEPPVGTYPVMWPGAGQSTTILGYQGTEWPDPLTSCPGFEASYGNPSGPPIYLQIGSGSLTPSVTATSFKQGTTPLEHCVFDETSYTNSSGYDQNLGRLILNSRDAIILFPKEPLQAGLSYNVSITANGQTFSWSFTAKSSTHLHTENRPAQIQPVP